MTESRTPTTTTTPSVIRRRMKKDDDDDDDDDDDYTLNPKDENENRRGKTRKSSDSSSSQDSPSPPSSSQRRLHVWTDQQVVLLMRAAVSLKVDPNSVSWGKMTGYYAEMARVLRESPNATEEWGENIDSTLTVSKIRSKFESVLLLLASNRYRVRSKDPKIREELQELYQKLRTLQNARAVITQQEAQKRWRDGLERLRLLWVATKKTDLPRERSQSALKLIRELKKVRPQIDVDGNCIFPDTVLFDGKVSSEVAAQAQAAVALGKNMDSLGSDVLGEEEDDDEEEACGENVNGTVEQQDESDNLQAPSTKQNDTVVETSSLNSPKPLLFGTSSHLPEQETTLHIQDVGRSKKVKRVAQLLADSYGPERKKHRNLPSEESCKELTTLLKQVLDASRTSTYCSDCNENGEQCNCRFSRTELLTSLCLTDSCPACHHPICHHP